MVNAQCTGSCGWQRLFATYTQARWSFEHTHRSGSRLLGANCYGHLIAREG